jgi:hypothetical protein
LRTSWKGLVHSSLLSRRLFYWGLLAISSLENILEGCGLLFSSVVFSDILLGAISSCSTYKNIMQSVPGLVLGHCLNVFFGY